MRRESEKRGFVCIYTKGNEKAYTMAVRHHAPLMEAWKAGRAFYDGTDLFEDAVTIKLGEVTVVALASPAGIETFDAEEAESKFKGDE